MDVDYEYIEDKKSLSELCKKLNKEKEIGIDIECENSFHHYGTYISIIQISTRKKNFIVDVLKIKDIKPLIGVLKNPQVMKVFHNIDFDFRILNYQYYCIPKNIFDTQMAAEFLGKENLGLANLLEEYFNIEKKKKFQKADWTKRPIKEKLLQYAAKDSQYLLKLKDILKKELIKQDKYKFIQEEFKNLEKTKRIYSKPECKDLKGYKSLTPKQRSVLKELFKTREKAAKDLDKPVHFIMPNKLLLKIAKEQSTNKKFWKTLKRVHPFVKQKYLVFVNAIKKGQRNSIEIHKRRHLRFSEKQKKQIKKLTEIREEISSELGIEPHLILSKDALKQVVINQSFDSLSTWQKKHLQKRFSF
jgi:ribonuclease D